MLMEISVQPLNDNVFIREDKIKDGVTTSGLIINSTSGQPISGQGEIVAISKSTIKKFKDEQGVDVKVGDKIYFSRFSAEDVIVFDENGLQIKGFQKIHMTAVAGLV
jgi:co-chaperonin GroES (HSP10)